MKINLTILSVVLAFAATSAHSAVSLLDEYRFGGNLTSENGKTLTPFNTNITYNGGVVISSTSDTQGGCFIPSGGYSATTNWAMQMDFKFQNSATEVPTKIFTSNNSTSTTANGISLVATQNVDGSRTFALVNGGQNSWSNIQRVADSNLQSATDMLKISLINKGGDFYLFLGNEQLTFENGNDHLTLSDLGLSSAILGNFMLGFGSNATNGISSHDPLTIGNLGFYTFGADDSLDDVKAGMGLGGGSVPEPTTGSLALLGLAACMLRRRHA